MKSLGNAGHLMRRALAAVGARICGAPICSSHATGDAVTPSPDRKIGEPGAARGSVGGCAFGPVPAS